ncbi:MAG: threonine synthase [Magnetococcales bacterium]|nr:threonine synthase [Magnetococcales bacterium]MBF0155072.1 threonine synthase [Magnetococcales bacterium]
MRYISTRGGVQPVGFAEAVMMGLATDGGLLLPERIPTIAAPTWRQWATLSFQDLAMEVMAPFVGEAIPAADLQNLITRSYATFSHPDITPVVTVGSRHVLELFHGPTLAFKDVALQFLGNLFAYLLARSGGRLNILGATSGDTGSAAIHGVRGKERIHIFIIHPHGRVSPIQERQMTTVLDANVHNIAVQGDFDDGQRIVKALFNDLEFKNAFQLGAVNSINWARILAQIVYYVYAWGRVSGGDTGRAVTFSVPTGNFGDIFAGYMARRMGLPIRRLILATNRNDILTRFMATGVYQTGQVMPTISPSMDIQVSSNFERYLYYLFAADTARVRTSMESLARTGRFQVTAAEQATAAREFPAMAASETATTQQIRDTFARYRYLLDPHTAVGFHAAQAEEGPVVCLATAHPAKFADAVAQAIGHPPELPAAFAGIMDLPTRCQVLPADADAVRRFMAETMEKE